MKLAYLALALVALPAGPVLAAPEDRDEAHARLAVIASASESLDLARAYFALLPVDTYVDALKASAQMAAGFDQIEDVSTRTSVERALGSVIERATPQIRQRVPALYEAYAQAFAREFSPDELRQLIVFAQSPVGRRFNAKYGAFEGDPAVVAANRQLLEELGPIMEDFAREMCAEKAALRMAAGDTKAKCSMG